MGFLAIRLAASVGRRTGAMRGAGIRLVGLPTWIALIVPLVLGAVLCFPAALQAQPTVSRTVPALLVSDIHFDPFADPEKVPGLVAAPVDRWDAILAGGPSAASGERFAAIMTACRLRGIDTSAQLWRSSLDAMRAQGDRTSFIVVSGDLLAHSFGCKYKQIFPAAKDADQLAFIEQTIRYLMMGMHRALPNAALYVALGNNDSGCGDYKDDRHSRFLAETAKILAQGIPAGDRRSFPGDFANEGFYNAALPSSVPNTRIVVLDNLFMSSHYASCANKPNKSVADIQLDWLRTQLAEAREHRQHVWVVGHIPPGVDLYATLTTMRNICGRGLPQMFLADDRMAETLIEFSDVITLAIFGHSHTDEMRLLQSEKDAARPGVAVKIITSISPINGNRPAFTIARIDPASATLADYTVVAASNLTGVGATWAKEYTFSESFHQPAFDASTVKVLTDGFRADPTAAQPESQAYLRDFYVGDRSVLIKPLWPEYVCALTHDTAQGFTGCVCKR